MNTRISPDNPFSVGRAAFAWEKVPPSSRCHLDFGCNDGRFLDSLHARNVLRLVGIDAARQAIQKGQRLFAGLELLHRTQVVPLPFDDATFDSISILDVLEHLHQQKALLDEFHRVLAPNGILIVTVPQQHVFSWLDLGNLKFRFPRLHCWFYCLKHSRQEYYDRYVANPENLVGDISAEKRWHEHFTRKHLAQLLADSGFSVIEFDGAGFLKRPLAVLIYLVGWVRPLKKLLEVVLRRDSQRFESTDLFCVVRKQERQLSG